MMFTASRETGSRKEGGHLGDADFLSKEFMEDPNPIYRPWRDQAPIWRSDHLQGWVISRYGEVSKVLVDYRPYG